jgi:UDP-N-acetylglucosamine 2-epimerase
VLVTATILKAIAHHNSKEVRNLPFRRIFRKLTLAVKHSPPVLLAMAELFGRKSKIFNWQLLSNVHSFKLAEPVKCCNSTFEGFVGALPNNAFVVIADSAMCLR